ncbi:iron chaperone [Neptunicella sp. SCSIO 80796]|uniref:iron chaperone n=1 Tax=Neptunicella plasticusilytica TaxID=3117012 RepID=UPI003A4DB9C5
MSAKPDTVSNYILSKPVQAQTRLNELRAYLQLADKDANEELKWGKPAFVNEGILYVYAAFKNHISLHPTPSVIEHFKHELSLFKLSGNTVQFPIEQPIPKELVLKLAKLRVYQKNEQGIGWK